MPCFAADNTSLTHEDLSKFEYLSMVINESHRIMPPVPGVSRELEEDLCVEGNHISCILYLVTLTRRSQVSQFQRALW